MAKSQRATRLGRAVEVPPSSPGKVSGFQDFKSLDVGGRGHRMSWGGLQGALRFVQF